MGQYEQAFRCFVLNSHLYPTNLNNIQSLQSCIIEGSQVRDFESGQLARKTNIEENRSLKELQLRQLMVNPSDFELRVFFLRKLIDKYLGATKRDEKRELESQIYKFVLDYFNRKYISKIVNIQANYSMLNMEQVQEFKMIIEMLQQNKLERYALELNRLVIKLAPSLDPQLFLSQYDLYLKFDDYLNAFKSYSHFMYLTGNNSIESYAICGECLEKAGYYHKAIIAFWQCHLLQQQELMTYRQQEQPKDFDSEIDETTTTPISNNSSTEEKIAQYDKKSLKYLFHIKQSIVPKLKSSTIPLTTEQQEIVERIIQITELENDYSINN
ncbi:predicted protein [Naegleria gruberi]|uniref:Predicted protein n=1 Tax=Naegleria gruberi TaxID=5762 RepID=D2VHS1_NAEGR|nr:uncharacterized protein NAEGRDRAFT_49642 [Naegleria gruberi]EFC43722.1 predicted protein [Naegleria gruberi]|eukprot:XP_002676466.1 predicted protein [Naegleria gruberi strain NEG-M]